MPLLWHTFRAHDKDCTTITKTTTITTAELPVIWIACIITYIQTVTKYYKMPKKINGLATIIWNERVFFQFWVLNKRIRWKITKSYRLPSNCFLRAPLLLMKLLSLSRSDASCSRISKSLSPCNFFKTREDIFIAFPALAHQI